MSVSRAQFKTSHTRSILLHSLLNCFRLSHACHIRFILHGSPKSLNNHPKPLSHGQIFCGRERALARPIIEDATSRALYIAIHKANVTK